MLLVHLMDSLKARTSPKSISVDKSHGPGDWDAYKRWVDEWPLEPPFPGMVSGINKYGEKYWATPVKTFTREEIEDYVSKSS